MGQPQARPYPHVVGGSRDVIEDTPSTVCASVALHWKRRVDVVCERYEDAWTEGSSPRLEDFLRESEIPEGRRAALLAELLKLERELREKRGEVPHASEYLSRFPSDLMVVRSVFGQDRIGDYDLLEPIGEGGMGVVYHARHRKIGREVALKLIRPYCIEDSSAVDRFRLEARLAARLEHANIVPIYEAGLADGQHYYTMRYIAGQCLSERIGKVPMNGDAAADIMEQVSRGVDFAHTHDVLHRDIKPRNILIDATGHAYVTDFGLAKALGGTGTGATRTDDRLGTPPYMSPEQVRDPSRAGVASDVYSLGASFYECLTGRAPFQAENPLEVYRQVLDVEPAPPRSINPRCPRDLETICLKCLEKDPALRYSSALALAQDLHRFRERLPILARRVGPVERVGKWGRKHPTAAALIFVSGLAALLVAAVVQTHRTNTIIETSYERARSTVDAVTQFGERRLSDDPTAQKELLEIVLRYYNDFLAQRGHDPEIAENLGDTFTRVARLNTELNSRSRALKAHQEALDIRRDLVRRSPKVRRHREALAETLHDIGILERGIGRLDLSIGSLREALKIRADLVNADPGCRAFLEGTPDRPISSKDRVLVGNLARSYGYIGDWERESGLKEAAKKSYDQAQSIRAKLASTDPTDLVAKYQLARSESNSGLLLREIGRIEEAIASQMAALRLQEQLVALGEQEASSRLNEWFRATDRIPDLEFDDFRTDLATTFNYLGILHDDANRPQEAIRYHQQAAKLLDDLVKEHPGVPRWDTERALTATYLGELMGSRESLGTGKKLLEKLLAEDRGAPRLRASLARNYSAIGQLALKNGRNSEAVKLLGQARRIQEKLLQEQPANFEFQKDFQRTKAAMDRRK